MKKQIILTPLFILLFSGFIFAGNGDLFTFDKSVVQEEMAELNALEVMLQQDAELTFEDLLEVNHPLLANVSHDASLMGPNMINGPIIPAFWWGCIFGPVGVLVVYIVEDDRAQTKSAFWGCLISTLVWGTSSWYWWWR